MTTESFTETSGPYGGTHTTISGTGVKTVSALTNVAKRQVSRTKIYTKRHKPVGWLYPQAYTFSIDSYDNGYGRNFVQRSPLTTSPSFNNTIDDIGVQANYSSKMNDGVYDPVSSVLTNKAVIKALLKLKDQQVNFSQAFAERQMTANLLGDSLSRIARSVQLLRRRKLKQAWKVIGGNPKTLPQSWLEYQYGWKPLMQDVFNSAKLLQERNATQDWVVTVKGNSNADRKTETIYTGQYAAIKRQEFRNGCFVRLDYTPDNKLLILLSQLGFTNPALLAWELMPYSFVIDWGLSVGDWLSSLDAAVGWQFLSGSKTYRRECKTKVRAVWGKHGQWPLYDVLVHDYECHRKNFEVVRTPYSSSPLPSFPGVKSPLSLTHAANGLSLLAQALKGGPPRAF
jgi:hypothetical protein